MSRKYTAAQFVPANGGIIDTHPNLSILGYFAGVPTASIAGYEIGAIAVDITNGNWYRNTGTTSSATWTRQTGTITAETITTLTSTQANLTTAAVGTLTGNAAGTTIAVTDRMTTTDGVASGTARVVGGLAYSNTAASTAIASTSAETVFDTNYNIPANTLKAGSVVKVRFQGIQTALVGTDTLAFKLYIGGSGGTALITAAATTGVSNGTIQGECTIVCRTAGTTGTFVSTGTYKVISAEGTMTVKDDIQASTTINTQAAQLVTATGTFNTTNANSVRMDVFTVEIY